MKAIASTIILLFGFTLNISSQQLKENGTTVNSIVPEGWSFEVVNGDLNKDGHLDMAILTYPNYSEHMKVREDGYVYNFNQPLLAIYFGESSGNYRLWKSYDNVVPAREDEFISIDASLNITPRGTLEISISEFSSAGSWQSTSSKYTYRYQNGDFFLIGKDEESMWRNSGERSIVSENYLTHKRQCVTDNVFNDNVKRKEVWSKLERRPLQRMGEAQ
ncbi:MAG: hypothetical protein IKT00_04140 [Prevotella sp.]|nr:hypothetical protein [Prevotella sp.]